VTDQEVVFMAARSSFEALEPTYKIVRRQKQGNHNFEILATVNTCIKLTVFLLRFAFLLRFNGNCIYFVVSIAAMIEN
jgi:hypothetical protein